MYTSSKNRQAYTTRDVLRRCIVPKKWRRTLPRGQYCASIYSFYGSYICTKFVDGIFTLYKQARVLFDGQRSQAPKLLPYTLRKTFLVSLTRKHMVWKVGCCGYSEKSFWNLIKSIRNQIVFTIFRLIWIQTGVRLDLNQLENGKYNLISGWFNETSETFLYV